MLLLTIMTGLPWIEKYRPKTLSSVIGQDNIVNILKKYVEKCDMPHIIVAGPPGTGKTSAIRAMARDMYGPLYFNKRVLEINASQDNGIKAVRTTIKDFSTIAANEQILPDGKVIPGFKLIIMDEADCMTKEAQKALRMTIEDMSKNTRFCFICNFINGITEPILSRCHPPFEFTPLPIINIIESLINISLKEKIDIDNNALKTIIKLSRGDMRRAIKYMQGSSEHCKILNKKITSDIIWITSGYATEKTCLEVIERIKKLNCLQLSDYVSDIQKKSYPLGRMIGQIKDIIVDGNYDDKQKAQVVILHTNKDLLISKGCDEYIQILDFFI